MSNKITYQNKKIVKFYSNKNYLQPPEKTILEELSSKGIESMLDIGVGGGRTTSFFSKISKEYLGIDYSKDMIDKCEQKFTDIKDFTGKFDVVDARDMSCFKDNSFDFILFSFNGIDYVSNKDRKKILSEIHRVITPTGYFAFSTHNKNKLYDLFVFRFQLPPWYLFPKKIIKWILLKFIYNRGINKELIKKRSYLIVNDGAHGFSSKTFYIDPVAQIKELKKSKFIVNSILSLGRGEKLSQNDIENNYEPWLYYFCSVNKS